MQSKYFNTPPKKQSKYSLLKGTDEPSGKPKSKTALYTGLGLLGAVVVGYLLIIPARDNNEGASDNDSDKMEGKFKAYFQKYYPETYKSLGESSITTIMEKIVESYYQGNKLHLWKNIILKKAPEPANQEKILKGFGDIYYI